jgi:hypothetical protein
MGNYFGIFSDVGRSIGTMDSIQRQGKVLTNAAKGAGKFLKKSVSINNPLTNVGKSTKKFIKGFGNSLIGPRRETVYHTDSLLGRTTRKTHIRERMPNSLPGFVGSIAAHEYLRKNKKINRSKSNNTGSFFNRFRKKSVVKSEEQQPLLQQPSSETINTISSIESSSQQTSLTLNNSSKKKKLLQTPSETRNTISSIENSSQTLNNSSKNKKLLQPLSETRNTISSIENSSKQSLLPPKKNKSLYKNKNNNLQQPPLPLETTNQISRKSGTDNFSQQNQEEILNVGNNKKFSKKKKNISENQNNNSKNKN